MVSNPDGKERLRGGCGKGSVCGPACAWAEWRGHRQMPSLSHGASSLLGESELPKKQQINHFELNKLCQVKEQDAIRKWYVEHPPRLWVGVIRGGDIYGPEKRQGVWWGVVLAGEAAVIEA